MSKPVIITGGPGSGKTTLITQLTDRGFSAMPEAGRAIIKHQTHIGGKALPWSDCQLFAEWMLCWDLRSYQEACAMTGPVLMDRGIGDIIGYLTLCQLPIGDHYWAAAEQHPYHPTVFLAPFWPEIFEQDDERKQSLSEAEATADVMANIYQKLGYRVVELPRAMPDARTEFILHHLRQDGVSIDPASTASTRPTPA